MMDYSALIKRLKEVVKDVYTTDVEFTPVSDVPNVNTTTGLTFESGDVKRGRTIKTCVLYVDIRNSVQLIKDKQTKTMGKIYTAFTKAVLIAAREEGGCVRNIIGDRVMVVFPEKDCFEHAVHCAFTINNISTIINQTFPTVDFSCGIGIDYGTMSVLKVGIDRRDDEKQENMNLVWVGYPANYASRLTDVANKTVTERYRVIGNPGILGIEGPGEKSDRTYDKEELLSNLSSKDLCFIPIFHRPPIKIEAIEHKFRPILVSEVVYNGFAAACPDEQCIVNKWWYLEDYPIKDIPYKVYGTGVVWAG